MRPTSDSFTNQNGLRLGLRRGPAFLYSWAENGLIMNFTGESGLGGEMRYDIEGFSNGDCYNCGSGMSFFLEEIYNHKKLNKIFDNYRCDRLLVKGRNVMIIGRNKIR